MHSSIAMIAHVKMPTPPHTYKTLCRLKCLNNLRSYQDIEMELLYRIIYRIIQLANKYLRLSINNY